MLFFCFHFSWYRHQKSVFHPMYYFPQASTWGAIGDELVGPFDLAGFFFFVHECPRLVGAKNSLVTLIFEPNIIRRWTSETFEMIKIGQAVGRRLMPIHCRGDSQPTTGESVALNAPELCWTWRRDVSDIDFLNDRNRTCIWESI